MNEGKDSIFIGKNETADLSKNQPPIYISLIRNNEFIRIADCWKTKSGSGYSCAIKEEASISIQDIEKVNKQFDNGGAEPPAVADDINPDDIPF